VTSPPLPAGTGLPDSQASPTRSTVDGRAYLDLRRLARRDRRTTAEYLRLYALEGFLTRLTVSEHADAFVLKGGVLLAAYLLRRPTIDIDFAAIRLANDVPAVTERILAIAGTPLTGDDDDGLRFDRTAVRAETIREQDQYSGVRVTLRAHLASAVETFHVDVNIGDPIWPPPQIVQLPRLLGGAIELRGYPLVMVLAEKVVTALQRATANTRWRDFADLYLLTGTHPVTARAAHTALVEVAGGRRARLVPLRTQLAGYGADGQDEWARWTARLQMGTQVPQRFEDVLNAVSEFTDPLITQVLPEDATWSPTSRTWSTT
jgi:hypothetical protein